jgi:hypothetical protein
MLELAEHERDLQMPFKAIADAHGIPLCFLIRILSQLRAGRQHTWSLERLLPGIQQTNALTYQI